MQMESTLGTLSAGATRSRRRWSGREVVVVWAQFHPITAMAPLSQIADRNLGK